jgi:hypothetical protein
MWDRDTPWRQGHLLKAQDAIALGLQHPQGEVNTRVLIVSHDCDLAQLPDAEPNVEVIVGCTVDCLDGNYTHGKNSRRLQIQFDGPSPCLAQFDAVDKHLVRKAALLPFTPKLDTNLAPKDRHSLRLWLASRYRRSAFPNEFETRLRIKECGRLGEKIDKLIKPCGDLVLGIFFDVDDGEELIHEGPEDPYTLDILVLHPTEPDFFLAVKAAETLAKDIQLLFRKALFDNETKEWKYIELRSCQAVSESVLTYEQFKTLNRWRFEHMSLGSDPQQETLVE